MKKIRIGFLPVVVLLLAVTVSSCSYSSYPPRPYYGNAYDYGYGYGNRYGYAPRVMVVRPAPRVVYRNAPPRYRYNVPNNARPSIDSRNNGSRNNGPRSYGTRSNRNYSNNSSRGRSSGPR